MASQRLTMFRSTSGVKSLSVDIAPLTTRGVSTNDVELLGALLFSAYFGTIDHRGETLEEFIQESDETMLGRYGSLIWSASFVVLSEVGQVISASIVTENEKLGPLLAFAATLPSYQNRGLARCLINKSLEQLKLLKIDGLTLVVTPGNKSAIHLYRKLGFTECDPE